MTSGWDSSVLTPLIVTVLHFICQIFFKLTKVFHSGQHFLLIDLIVFVFLTMYVCVFFPGPITCVCFSQDSHCTLSSSLDSTVRLLDKTTGDMLGE